MQKVYFISGLGADKRIFSFLDLSFCEPVFINWIAPHANESLVSYALRLREQIPAGPATVVGISFGGMLATEMANHDPSLHPILISSSKTNRELPRYFTMGRYMPVYKWFSGSIARNMMLRSLWILGAKGKEQKELLRQITLDSDIAFGKWAMNAILHWNNTKIPSGLVHIHGTDDRLIPLRCVKADYIIKGGTHVMPLDNPNEISALLKQLIIEYPA
ncbi:MAG TPA: alpha/beta hydrolase [Chitinophagaceae bacterium]